MAARTAEASSLPLLSRVFTNSEAEADAEAATQQLLAESRASASKPRQPPQSAAVRGASLLNAARVHDRPSSPTAMARRAGAGKLKRPSMVAEEQPRTNLARRGDTYEIMSSPEKGAFKLPETVNHHPLKIVRKKQRARQGDEDRGDELGKARQHSPGRPTVHKNRVGRGEENMRRPESISELQLPSSPPGYPANSIDLAEIDEYLPDGRIRCSAITQSRNKNRKSIPIQRQCLNQGIHMQNGRSRCSHHFPKRLPMHESAQLLPLKGSEAEDQESYTRRGTKRKPEEALDNLHKPSKPLNSHLQEVARLEDRKGKRSHATSQTTQRPMQASTRRKGTKAIVDPNVLCDVSQGGPLETTEIAVPDGFVQGRQTRSRRRATNSATSSAQHKSVEDMKKDAKKATKNVQSTREGISTQVASSVNEAEDDGLGSDELELDAVEPGGLEQSSRPSSSNDIDQVFKSLHIEERPGNCQTKLGATIKRASERSCILIQSEGIAIDAIVKSFEDVQGVLRRVTAEVSEYDQLAFKSDAYGYIFRALVSYLEAVHRWFGKKCGSIKESLAAMRILSPLTHEILALKDTIAKWGVSVPQRYKGDKIIMDVESNIIAPLRLVNKSFHLRLCQLEATEQRRQELAVLKRMREAKEDEERRIMELNIASKARWKRWQDLHISRMQCEPDLKRRRRLVISRLDDMEEKDANGIKFERVPVFRARSTPPLHWMSLTSAGRQWTDEEETALLEGLQRFAGPHVFELIFEAHCRPGCVLRDFTVTEIIAKSAWVHSAFIKLHQEKGWDIPRWVELIPALP
ncbi:Nn.00g086180.m01.CDS01 [Neocucurbitaria sp. VM-36]